MLKPCRLIVILSLNHYFTVNNGPIVCCLIPIETLTNPCCAELHLYLIINRVGVSKILISVSL